MSLLGVRVKNVVAKIASTATLLNDINNCEIEMDQSLLLLETGRRQHFFSPSTVVVSPVSHRWNIVQVFYAS